MSPLPPAGPDDMLLARFRALLSTRLGLVYPDRQAGMLVELLLDRARRHALDPLGYLVALEGGLMEREFDALAPTLTTGETYFFRNIEQFHVLRERVLPELLAERKAQGRGLSILSAGCSSGEELYTIAMLMQDLTPGEAAAQHKLLGVDLNPKALRKAREALYTGWSLRETPAAARERWFQPEGTHFRLRPELREAVGFEPLNLGEAAPDFWRPGRFDVIFARNVLMYFSREALEAALARMTRALMPGGYLFLGHSESLRELTRGYKTCHTHGTFYYQRELAEGDEQLAPDDWFAAIGRAAERVRGITAPDGKARHVSTAGAPSRAQNRAGFAAALALFGEERFEAAEQALDALPPAAAEDGDALLLRAMLRVHHGQLQPAEDLAHEVLTREPRNAAAHYVIGLCRESGGDLSAAANRYALAARTDPGFALAHLQLGRLARRRGDGKTQRLELHRAAQLLEHERPQRLVMFGGGFDRKALMALCRADAGPPHKAPPPARPGAIARGGRHA